MTYRTKAQNQTGRPSAGHASQALSALLGPATAVRISRVRTYSHAALTWIPARVADRSEASVAARAAPGATVSDLPAVAGAARLGPRRRRHDRPEFREEVCKKSSFAGPDAALYSTLPVGALLLIFWTFGPGERSLCKPLLGFLMGRARHILADALTNAADALPILWPISERRFRIPYLDRSHHARAFTMVEHGTLLLLVAWTISRGLRAPRPSDPPSD